VGVKGAGRLGGLQNGGRHLWDFDAPSWQPKMLRRRTRADSRFSRLPDSRGGTTATISEYLSTRVLLGRRVHRNAAGGAPKGFFVGTAHNEPVCFGPLWCHLRSTAFGTRDLGCWGAEYDRCHRTNRIKTFAARVFARAGTCVKGAHSRRHALSRSGHTGGSLVCRAVRGRGGGSW